jgi:glyoxylate reductase
MSQAGDVAQVLALAGVQRAILDRLAERHRILGPLALPLCSTVAHLSEAQASRVRVLVIIGSSEISRTAMAALPHLGLIACTGAGYEGVDLRAAAERGIRVTHSPRVSASSVADIAVGLLIASIRKMLDASAKLRTCGPVKPWPATSGLTGRCVGVYGLGAIGSKVAQRLSCFEVRLGYCSRRRRPNLPYRHFDDVLALAEWADALIICVPATPQTVGSVNARVLAALGPNGHIVNVGRGSVIDSAALDDALTHHAIAGAALDVYDPAFLSRLLVLPNVILTPHIGGATTQAETAMAELVRRNVDAFLNGEELSTPVPEPATASDRVAHEDRVS